MSGDLLDLNEYLKGWLDGAASAGALRAPLSTTKAFTRGFEDGDSAFRSACHAERLQLGLLPLDGQRPAHLTPQPRWSVTASYTGPGEPAIIRADSVVREIEAAVSEAGAALDFGVGSSMAGFGPFAGFVTERLRRSGYSATVARELLSPKGFTVTVTPLGAGGSGVAAGPFPRENLPHPPAWTGDHPPPAPAATGGVRLPHIDALRQTLEREPGAGAGASVAVLPQLATDLRAIIRSTLEALGAQPETVPGELPRIAAAALEYARGEGRRQPTMPMLLWCPECGERHVDVGVWATRRHHTHACQHCGNTWRPAVIDTFGVQFLPGFKNEPEGGAA